MLQRLRRDQAGAIAIETALIAPLLVLLSLGAFQVSMLVARQSELQGAAAEAATIVMAAKPETEAEIESIVDVLRQSAGLDEGQVTIDEVYRCGTDEAHVAASESCDPGEEVSTFLQIVLTDRLTPPWARIGFGLPIDYRVVRTVQLSWKARCDGCGAGRTVRRPSSSPSSRRYS